MAPVTALNRRSAWGPVQWLVALGLFHFCASSQAASVNEAPGLLRVRSAPHFATLRTSPESQGHRVDGFLQDEQNAPVAGARIEPVDAVRSRPCQATSAVTDEQGRFCLWLESGGDLAKLKFVGGEHFEPAQVQLSLAQLAAPPTLTLQTSPEFLIGQQENPVRIVVEHPPSSAEAQLQLRLFDSRQTELGTLRSPLDAGQATFSLGAPFIRTPGPLTLEATLLSGTAGELAKASTQVDAITIVSVQVADLPPKVRAEEAFPVNVSTTAGGAPVDAGWVEVRSGALPVAIGPVVSGHANVQVTLSGSRRHNAELSVHYVAADPWHRPGAPVLHQVEVLGPLPWLHLPWAVFALGAGFWVLRTWRRPMRAVIQTLSNLAGASPRAGARAASGPRSDWSGVVQDAHTRQPLTGVKVSLTAPALKTALVLHETVTDEYGAFVLPGMPLPEGARLLFTLKTHSTLNQAAPGPCVLEVDLVDRRRTLLAAFHEWIRATPLTPPHFEPTPQCVATSARHASDSPSESWAVRIDEAVFGPTPPDEALEQRLLQERPAQAQSSAKAR